MAKINRASGKGKVQTLAADNTNRLITEGVLRELLIDLWDSGALQIDEETFLNLQDLADRDYRVGECMVYDNGQGFKIFRATTAGGGIPFVAANWEILTSSGGTANTLYSADGVISGVRKISLPDAPIGVFWNGGAENDTSVFEIGQNNINLGGQAKVFTNITGGLKLNPDIQQNTSPDPVRILAYDPVNYVTKYINSNEIAGSNIYTTDGELTDNRALTANGAKKLTQRYFDSDISTYQSYVEIESSSLGFSAAYFVGDGSGSTTSVSNFTINTSGINFFSGNGTGIGYINDSAFQNIDWETSNRRIPCIQQIKDNTVSSNIYTADGTLTGDREVLGDSKNYTLGTDSSPVKLRKSYSSGGSTNFNISDGSVDGDFTEYHNVGDGAFAVQGFYAKRKLGATNLNGIDAVQLIAGSKEAGNWFGFYDYEESDGQITLSSNIRRSGSSIGETKLELNISEKDFVFTASKYISGQSDEIRSEFCYDRNTGFSFDDRELGLGVRYAGASSYANVDWNDPTFANHIPSIQQVKDNTVAVADLPYTVAPDLVTFDRDVQIPNNSLLVGDATKLSDMAQSLGYTTKFDGKEYILMGYEITENGNQRPFIKSFSDPSSFDLQPLTDDTEAFTGLITFDITSAQQVIGKTYRFNLLSDTDLTVKVFRLAEGTGADAEIVSEVIPAASTSLTGFDFDLMPLVDFEIDKVYRLEIDNGTGNGQVQGTIISGPNPYSVSTLNVNPNFVPYLKRQTGWVYDKKAIGYQDEGLSGLYPVFISSNETLSLNDRLVICQPVFVGANIELTLPDIQVANDNKYFVEVYNGSENDSFDVIVKDNAGNPLFTVKSRERMLYFPLGNTWESIVLSTQVFTDDSIDGTGAFSDPLSRPKLYAHVGVTNNAPVQNNTNVPLLIDTWDLNIPSDGLYNVHVTVEYNINVANRDAIFRFDVNGATGIEINQEAKDATNNIFFTTFAFDTLQAGNNTIEFYASIENPQGSNRVEIRSNRYTAQKIDVLS